MRGHVMHAGRRPAAVQLPIEQPERDVVDDPDDGAGLQQETPESVTPPPWIRSTVSPAVWISAPPSMISTSVVANRCNAVVRRSIRPGSPMIKATSSTASRIGTTRTLPKLTTRTCAGSR